MRTVAAALALTISLALGIPGTAFAGGNEFPADGVIGLGRGGTSFTRADDPSVMLRNPALLSELWGDQAMIGGHVLLTDGCFQPTGAYGGRADSVDLGDGPFALNADPGSTDASGNPVPEGLLGKPYEKVCFDGPIPYFPQVGLSMKLRDDLGVGLGFFPPEYATINQWGNEDGTVYSKSQGRLVPNPMRYGGTHVNSSYFTLLGALGYRIMPGLSVGLGFKWSLLALDAVAWSSSDQFRDINGDVRVDVFARDLFIPGINASVQYTPTDAIDVAVGFKWEDRIRASAKIDLTAGYFGLGQPYGYIDADGQQQTVGSRIPTYTPNLPGTLNVPPISVPQLSFGVRYADRIKPRIRDWGAAKAAAGRHVEDHMSNERWDVEADMIVYFNGFRDRTEFLTSGSVVSVSDVQADGTKVGLTSIVGQCISPDDNSMCPEGRYRTQRLHGGNTQLSLRVGGDYNILPGIFSVRTGVSLENSGADVGFHDPRNYNQERLGVHAGWTWRIAEVTDLTFGWAMFFHPEIYLAPNNTPVAMPKYSLRYRTDEYNWIDPDGPDADRIDGYAKSAVPYRAGPTASPQFYNAGTYTYDLQVFSLQLTQHF